MKLQRGGRSLRWLPKRESRGGRGMIQSSCQEPDFIFSSLVHGRRPSSLWNYVIPITATSKQGVRNRGTDHTTTSKPFQHSLVAGCWLEGTGWGSHQWQGSYSWTSRLQTPWYLHAIIFCLSLYRNRNSPNLNLLITTESWDLCMWDSVHKNVNQPLTISSVLNLFRGRLNYFHALKYGTHPRHWSIPTTLASISGYTPTH